VSLVYSETWYKTFLHTTVQVKSQQLYRQNTYSEYQEYLYSLCRKLKDSGLGYRRISKTLTLMNLKSVRGTSFTNGHVQSILNKGLVRKKRLESIKSREENGYKITDMKLEFIKI
jgi:hypothetical protein